MLSFQPKIGNWLAPAALALQLALSFAHVHVSGVYGLHHGNEVSGASATIDKLPDSRASQLRHRLLRDLCLDSACGKLPLAEGSAITKVFCSSSDRACEPCRARNFRSASNSISASRSSARLISWDAD